MSKKGRDTKPFLQTRAKNLRTFALYLAYHHSFQSISQRKNISSSSGCSHHHFPMPRKPAFPRKSNNLLTWFLAILCTIITVAVVIIGLVVFVGYLAIRPKLPSVSVTGASLDAFNYDRAASSLTTKISLTIKWENDNAKAHASFYDVGFILGLDGLMIAKLVADPFELRKKSSVELHYTVEVSPVPLNLERKTFVEMSLRRDLVAVDLKGAARTRWRVGVLGSVKFWLHLDCQLHFVPSTKSITGLHCSSKSR